MPGILKDKRRPIQALIATDTCIVAAGCVGDHRVSTDGSVVVARCVIVERESTVGRIIITICWRRWGKCKADKC
jgi:hypothetical protein